MYIIICPKCNSKIAIDDTNIKTFDIDCDCGEVIQTQKYNGIVIHAT